MARSKLLPIRFNIEEKKQLDELIETLGISKTFGAVPKAVKFAINMTNQHLKNIEQVIPRLEMTELELLFQSMRLLRKQQERNKKIVELQKEQ